MDLHYLGKYNDSPVDEWTAFFFFKYYHALVAAGEIISLHWVSDCGLKTQNRSYHADLILTASFFFHEAPILGMLRNFVSSINNLLRWILFQSHLFSDFSKKQTVSLLSKTSCRYEYPIVLILLINSMRNTNTQLSQFAYLFQVAEDFGLGYNEINGSFFCVDCIAPNPFKAYWSRYGEYPILCSSLNCVLLERNFENEFRIRRSVMICWP